jgi:hypothetical protein
MKKETREKLKNLLRDVIVSKLNKYSPETEYKPFFAAVFSPEQILAHSMIQSFYTTFGMSVYEQMGKILAEGAGYHAEIQYDLLGEIDSKTEVKINQEYKFLLLNTKANKSNEIAEIRKHIKSGKPIRTPNCRVDLFVKKPNGEEFYFDITTVKPNKKEFQVLKLKLLNWVALRLSQDKNAIVNTAVVIPYNPYHPEPYSRWTKSSLYSSEELLVGRDFWDLVGGGKTYDELLEVFKEIGLELRGKIDLLVSSLGKERK